MDKNIGVIFDKNTGVIFDKTIGDFFRKKLVFGGGADARQRREGGQCMMESISTEEYDDDMTNTW